LRLNRGASRAGRRRTHIFACAFARRTLRNAAFAGEREADRYSHGLRDFTNCWVGIVMGRTRNGLAGATITTDKARQGGNRLVTQGAISK
jgi:hypothetical protein